MVSITSPLNLSYLHCTDEEIEAQRGERASPTSQSDGPVTQALLIPTSTFRTCFLLLCLPTRERIQTLAHQGYLSASPFPPPPFSLCCLQPRRRYTFKVMLLLSHIMFFQPWQRSVGSYISIVDLSPKPNSFFFLT